MDHLPTRSQQKLLQTEGKMNLGYKEPLVYWESRPCASKNWSLGGLANLVLKCKSQGFLLLGHFPFKHRGAEIQRPLSSCAFSSPFKVKLRYHSFSIWLWLIEGSFFALSTARHWGYETALDTRGSHSLAGEYETIIFCMWIRRHAVRAWHWLLTQSQIGDVCSQERVVKLKPKSCWQSQRKREQHRQMSEVRDAQPGLELVGDMRLAKPAVTFWICFYTTIRVHNHRSGDITEER